MGDGIEAHRVEIIKYMELSEDESKRQMALSAAACEQFERGQITPEQYSDLLDKALNSSVEAQSFNGEDFKTWLDKLQAAEKSAGDASAVATKAEFDKLEAQLDSAISAVRGRADEVAAQGAAARQDPAKAQALAAGVSDRGRHIEQVLESLAPDVLRFQADTSTSLVRIETRIAALESRMPPAGGGAPNSPSAAVIERLSGSTSVFFKVGDATVEDPYANELRALTQEQLRHPGCTHPFATVAGYADVTGDASSNLRLAGSRADGVAALLRSAGVAEITTDPQGATTSFGSSLQMNRVVLVQLRCATTPRAQQ